MEDGLKQTLAQKQQQRLMPMQVQFVKLLEMTAPEVEDEVRHALDENPALEVADENSESDTDANFNESSDQLLDADYANEDDIPSYRLNARNYSPDDDDYEPMAIDSSDTLIDELTRQLNELELTEKQHNIAQYIIGNIDDNGYLTRTLREIIDDLEINVGLDITTEEAKDVYDIVRSLDPPGIAAIDLRDTLLLQLKRLEPSPIVNIATEIIRDYYDFFAKRHNDKLQSALNISSNELNQALNVIRALNPKPGAIFGSSGINEALKQVAPDFAIDVDGERISISLTTNYPDLAIEQSFNIDTLDKRPIANERDREARLFIKQKHDEAAQFINVLKLRNESLFKVMQAIVSIQKDFFITEDVEKIKPMILKDIANITGQDLSVISRATSGKYISTRSGIYPLKMFFSERPNEDDDTSVHQILAALKSIIDSENKLSPYSDEDIKSLLAEKDIVIARRTIAKYREKLGIPVARLRKDTLSNKS